MAERWVVLVMVFVGLFSGYCFVKFWVKDSGGAATGTADPPSGMTTRKATASATAQWPGDGLNPTLRHETAKVGAPRLVWRWGRDKCVMEAGRRLGWRSGFLRCAAHDGTVRASVEMTVFGD
jgi:hypothetical protein